MEEIEIDCLEGFEIQSPLLISRGFLAIDVVVVEGQGDHVDAVDPQLNAEPLGERRLS